MMSDPVTARAMSPMAVGRAAPLLRQNAAAGGNASVDGARSFQLFCYYTPLLWALGALTIGGVVVVLRLTWARWPRGTLINLVIASWLSIAAVQIITTVLYSISVGNFLGELPHLTSFAVVGWIFGALIIGVGSAHRLATKHTVRAICCLGVYMLGLELLCVPFRAVGFTPAGFQMTPIGLLLPASSAARFYTSFVLYMSEDTFGENFSRLMLFFPYFTALGLGALSVLFISTLEHDWRWRLPSMTGALAAVVFSWSRMAIFCAAAIGAWLIFLRLPRMIQVVGVCLSLIAGYGAMVNGFDPLVEYQTLQNDVDATRPGSNMARDLIYAKSWAGFVASPWLGNGLDFPRALQTEPIAVGSHSTTYGLLYTAGAPGLAAFLLAMTVTSIAMMWRYWTAPSHSQERQAILVGICLIICLWVYCPFEALYSLTLPCIALFAWIGACFPSPRIGTQPVARNLRLPQTALAPPEHQVFSDRTRSVQVDSDAGAAVRRSLRPAVLPSASL